MAGKTLVVATKFTAADKYSRVMQRMTVATTKFGRTAVATFNRIERAERRLRKGISGLMGKLGSLGLAFGGLAIAMTIGTATVQLEENLASLSAITGVTGDAFKAFEKQIDIVSKKQKVFSGDTAKAFEIVGSAKPELLGSAKALGTVTDAVITLSKASKDDLTISAENLTGAMNQFNLAADQSNRVINALAAGSVVGSANITRVNESLTSFGAVANGANITLEQSIGLIEVLGSKMIFGSEAGTALRGTILRLQAAGLGYKSGVFNINDALDEAKKKSDSFSTALKRDAFMQKTFGQRNITTGQILLSNIDKFKELTKGVTGTNTAFEQAAINSNTLKAKGKEIADAFKNTVTSTELQSDSMMKLKDVMTLVADNMDRIISTVFSAIKVFAIYKGVMLATKAVMFAYNVVLGVTQVNSATMAVGINSSTVAMKAQTAASHVVMAAQWAWNVALKAGTAVSAFYASALAPAIAATWAFTTALLSNPITWIVVGIAALIVGIIALVKNWKDIVQWVKTSDSWFAKLIRGSLKPIIWLIDGIKGAWNRMKDAFKGGGILGGLKSIGKSLLSFLLAPLEAILKVANKISGGRIGGEALKNISKFRQELTAPSSDEPPSEQSGPLNPDAAAAERTQELIQTKNEKVSIEVAAAQGSEATILQDETNRVNITPTLGWQN